VQPDNFRFGGGAADTILHPIVMFAMLIAVILAFILPRKYLVVPFILSTFLIPQGQQLVMGGFHVFALRIIVLAGVVRMIFSKRSPAGNLLADGVNSVDILFFLWVTLHAIAFTLLYRATGAIVNQVGYLWDCLGSYVILRFMICDEEDVERAIKCFAFLGVVLAACMVREQLTGQNIFGLLGGVNVASEVREGRIRSQAVFQHSLLAGTFGATAIPLFVYLWKRGKAKVLAVCGAIGATVMVATASSSTPVMAWVAGIGAVFFWPFRKRLRMVRWGLIVMLLSLTLVMQAPIWFLIARVSVTSGSSSYHRAMLVDQFVRHFSDWWLLGTNENEKWGFDMWDTSNRYVEEGETGGLAALMCFLGVIYLNFSRIGNARKILEKDRKDEWFLWTLGAAFFAHLVAFWGISYFDQTRVTWFALIAMIVATTAPALRQSSVKQDKPENSNLALSRRSYAPIGLPSATTNGLYNKYKK
jgi:hypothetical protein